MRTERQMAGDDRDSALWRAHARSGHLLNIAVLAIDMAYVLATWTTGSHRPFLLALNLAAIVGLVMALLVVPEAKVAASSRRDLIFGAWMLVSAVLITAAAVADGGARSPFAWLLPISVMFTAVAHRPKMVWLSGSFAMAGYLVVVVVGSVDVAAPATMTRLGCLAVLTYAAASAARSQWNHHDAQEARHDELSILADVDGLTGVLNHRAFHDRLGTELAACDRRSLGACLLLIDLDHFKSINDRYGHATGDAVLRQTGAAIVGAVRSGDVVGRVGGEEFAVFLGASSATDAHRLAERVRTAVAAITDPQPVTASVGIGTSDGRGTAPSELLHRADEALYLAKREGRNRTCCLRAA